jgi:hypothetical protein
MSDFSKAGSIEPVGLGGLEVRLYKAAPGDTEHQDSAGFVVQVRYSPGGVQERAGDLWPHLTAQERTQVVAFMNTLYQRAYDRIITGIEG